VGQRQGVSGVSGVGKGSSSRSQGAGQLTGPVQAALQGWYQRLCGAVAARDEQRVAQLVEQLGKEVLVAGQ
jgi:hypothetical protein